jgi:hypothetical protein
MDKQVKSHKKKRIKNGLSAENNPKNTFFKFPTNKGQECKQKI